MMRIARLSLLALLTACHSSATVGELEEVVALRAVPNRNLDLLFVVDNSGSMIEQQASLRANFTRIIERLEQLEGGLPNLHIGVVTSDLGTGTTIGPSGATVGPTGAGGCAGDGDNGLLRTTPALNGARFITDIELADGSRARNYTGTLSDVFGELANIGVVGCGFEQHLGAMSRALTSNDHFVRPEANLAVVIIADEDDCTVSDPALFDADVNEPVISDFRCTQFGIECDTDDLTEPGTKTGCRPRTTAPLLADVQPFIDALVAIKGDARTVMVAAIVGPPEPFTVELRTNHEGTRPALAPSCVFDGPFGPETALPAVRIAAFVDAFPGRSTLATICNDDLASALDQIGASAKKLMGDPCLDDAALVDVSSAPGIQPACEVVEVRDSAPTARIRLPECASGEPHCFELASDPLACPSAPGNLRLQVQRTSAPSLDTWTYVRCQTVQ